MTSKPRNINPQKPISVWLPLLAGVFAFIFFFRQKLTESLINPLKAWYVTQKFGGEHEGLDLRAAIGTEVFSPASGTVIEIYNKSQGGLQMRIKHDNGYTTGYAHLSKTLVAVNTKVKQGQLIALTGNTGVGTGPHLHLTLRDSNNNLLNPAQFFA